MNRDTQGSEATETCICDGFAQSLELSGPQERNQHDVKGHGEDNALAADDMPWKSRSRNRLAHRHCNKLVAES